MLCDDFFKLWIEKPELLTEIQTENLSDNQKQERETARHLRECPACAQKIAAFDSALDLIRNEIEEEQNAAFWHNMRAEVKKQLKPQPRWKRFLNWKWQPVWGMLPATLAAMLLLTFFPLNQVNLAHPDDIFLLSGGIPGFEYEIEIENNLISDESPDADSIYAAGSSWNGDGWTALLAETI